MKLLLLVFVIARVAVGQETIPANQGTPGHAFLCGDYTQGRLFLVDRTGMIVWQTDAPQCNDLWALANGNFLFTTGHGVKEMTRAHVVVFDYESPSSIYACQRLPDGTTFVGECNTGRLLIVSPAGKILKIVRVAPEGADAGGGYLRNVRYLPNGHFLAAHYDGCAVKEYDDYGAVVWQVRVPSGAHSAVRLTNGDTLVAATDKTNDPGVFEFDPSGKIVWQVTNQDLPGAPLKFITGLHRLPNGNTVFCNWLGHGNLGKAPLMFEVTPAKRVVWTYKNPCMMALGNAEILDNDAKPLPEPIEH